MLCAFTMFWLHGLNMSKIAQCEREGITIDESEVFAEQGDSSPLYRCVTFSIHSRNIPFRAHLLLS